MMIVILLWKVDSWLICFAVLHRSVGTGNCSEKFHHIYITTNLTAHHINGLDFSVGDIMVIALNISEKQFLHYDQGLKMKLLAVNVGFEWTDCICLSYLIFSSFHSLLIITTTKIGVIVVAIVIIITQLSLLSLSPSSSRQQVSHLTPKFQ